MMCKLSRFIGLPLIMALVFAATACAAKPSMRGQAHVQDKGWDTIHKVTLGDELTIGTIGKRLESVCFDLEGASNAHIQYTVASSRYLGHELSVESNHKMGASNVSIGATYPRSDIESFSVSDGWAAGTTGLSLMAESFKMSLGGDRQGYRLQYKVYVQGSGWTNWVEEGNWAGTFGSGKAIEAITVKAVQ